MRRAKRSPPAVAQRSWRRQAATCMSFDEEGARDAIRRRALPREGSWCIVDVVELDGVFIACLLRTPIRKNKKRLRRSPTNGSCATAARRRASPGSRIHAQEAETASGIARSGFRGLPAAPLVVRSAVLGAMTFITREGDAPFSPQEILLASDVAELCALALDNERLYRQARKLREAPSSRMTRSRCSWER